MTVLDFNRNDLPKVSNFSLIGASSYLPESVVENDFFINASGTTKHSMFRGTKLRHHISRDETAAQMIVNATEKLGEKLNLDLQKDIDIIVTNVSLPDLPFVGCGAVVAKKLGAKPVHIFDVSSGGCISFVFMMQLVHSLFQTTQAKTAIICNVQSGAGRVFAQDGNRAKPQSAVPGDGCGVAYLTRNDASPVLSLVTENFGEYAEDMSITAEGNRRWWEPGNSAFNIDFTESKLASVVARGNKLVPEALYAACAQADLPTEEIDCLVTNQPNRIFLRNWRESVGVSAEHHVQTFNEHGNLFGAAVPISIERAEDTGVLTPGKKLLIGGFSHAGDYSAAAVVDWHGNMS